VNATVHARAEPGAHDLGGYLTVNGGLQRNAVARSPIAPTYGANSTLIYATGVAVRTEWGARRWEPVSEERDDRRRRGDGCRCPPRIGRFLGNLTITNGTLALNARAAI